MLDLKHIRINIKIEELGENFLKLPKNLLRNVFKFNKIMRKFVKNLKKFLINFCKEYWNLRKIMRTGKNTFERTSRRIQIYIKC